MSSIAHRLATILAEVKRTVARDDPDALVVGMNYYDPFLGLEFAPGKTEASAEASVSLVLVDTFNARLASAYADEHVRMADIAAAFGSSAKTPFTNYDSRRLPRNVATICRLTWMCPATGTTGVADIHPNSSGYRVIAVAFERVVSGS